MPDRGTPGSGSSRDPGATRLDEVERLRRQMEQLESGGRSDEDADRPGSPRPQRRSGRKKRVGAGEGAAVGGVFRSDGGPVESDAADRGSRQVADASDDGAEPWSTEEPSPKELMKRPASADPEEWIREVVGPGFGSHSRRKDSESASPRDARQSSVDRVFGGVDPNGESLDARSVKSGSPLRQDDSVNRSMRGERPADDAAVSRDESSEPGAGRRTRRGGRRGAEPGHEPQGGTEAQAKEICLRLLTDRARSRTELADKLAAKGFTPEITERTLDRLVTVGLINDAAFAEQWVNSRHTHSGKGKKVLAQELRRKGITPEDAAPALESISADDERSRAGELVRQKLRSLPANLERDKAVRRLVGLLARRGYDPSTAYSVVTAELATAEFPDPPRHDEQDSGLSRLQQSAIGSGSERLRRRYPKPLPQRRTEADDRAAIHAAARAQESVGKPYDDFALAWIRRKLREMPEGVRSHLTFRLLIDELVARGYSFNAASTALIEATRIEFPGPPEQEPPDSQEEDTDVSMPVLRAVSADTPTDTADATDADTDDAAIALLRRKLNAMPRDLDREKKIRRLVGLLARRGYSPSQAYATVKAELAAAEGR